MNKLLFSSTLIFYIFSYLGTSYIPLFIIVSALFLLIILWRKVSVDSSRFAPLFIILSFSILGISSPLFENDHFRYFFEGKMFLEGINVYQIPPINLFLGAETIFQDNLGFPEVPSIYGPLAHIFHGVSFGLFGFSGALVFIKFLYFSTFLLLWKRYSSNLLLISIPFLTKEFFNSIHLDFFSVLFILWAIIQLQKEDYNKGLLLIFLSLLIKPTGFIALPLMFSYLYCKLSFKRLSLWSLPFILYGLFVSSWPSISIFAKNWQWNSGLANLIETFSASLASWSSLLAPLLLSVFILILHIKKGHWSIDNLKVELGLIFLFQLLFSQTVNSWYLAWPLGFFLFAERKVPVVWINLAWPLCYAPWIANDTVIYYTYLFHLSGISVFIYIFYKYLLDINFSKAFFNLLSPFRRKVLTGNQ